MTWELLLSQFWSIILLFGSLTFFRLSKNKKQLNVRYGWLIILLIAATARLVPNIVLPNGANYDIESFQFVGDAILQGEDIYTKVETLNRHPYLPFHLYWVTFSQWMSNELNISFVKFLRLSSIGADIAIALVLYYSLRATTTQRTAFFAGLIYAVNPIPVYVSAYHGQFDPIPALFTLLAIIAIKKSSIKAGSWLGLGILIKSWPILALPSLLINLPNWRNRVYLLILAILIPIFGIVLYVLIFNGIPTMVLKRALMYNHGLGVWGYTYMLSLLAPLLPIFKSIQTFIYEYSRFITLALLAGAWLFTGRKQSVLAGITTVLIAFLAISHAFAIQYLMWVVPFAVLSLDYKWLKRYTIAAFIYMFLTYNIIFLAENSSLDITFSSANMYIIKPIGLITWAVCIAWSIYRLRFSDQSTQVAQFS